MIKIILLISIFIIFFSLSSYPNKHWWILPDEPRIQDAKDSLDENNPNFPESFHLFFQEFLGDYAVFYDLNGHIAYYQYRRNKWDEENTNKYYYLLKGRSYRVRGNFIGIYYFPEKKETKRISPRIFVPKGENIQLEWLKAKNTIPVFQLTEAIESYSDSIIP